MGNCNCGPEASAVEEALPMSPELREIWANDAVPEPGEALPQDVLDGRLAEWAELGGNELEEPLRNGWVRLVRASWLVALSTHGGVLRRRQELPEKAFVGLDELKEAGPFTNGFDWTWLPIIVLSYPWLQPGHPDPHGESLEVVAKALKIFTDWQGPRLYGVLIDFTAMFQAERTEEESKMFKLALPALNLFYSHPRTVVLKVTKFPVGYPNGAHQYFLPEGANTVEYDERGWCFAESAMSSLVKPSSQVLDLGQHVHQREMFDFIRTCMSGRAAPLSPDAFETALDKKTFTSKSADFKRVAKLYADAFQRRLESAQELDFSGLRWRADDAQKLMQALRTNTNLQKLSLESNRFGDDGVAAVAEALHHNNTLQTLYLTSNDVGNEGAAVLGKALRHNSAILTLRISWNRVGDEGASALGEALRNNSCLQTLDLQMNAIGPVGATSLAEALRINTSLLKLDLRGNQIGSEGEAALAEARAAGRVDSSGL